MRNRQERIRLCAGDQTYLPADPYPKSKNQSRTIRPGIQKVKVQFKHTFQEYLKLALCKIIPQERVMIDPEEGVIYGSKEDCLQLKKKVQREFSSKIYKKVELKREHDLDELEYELDSKFSARIFRAGFIEKALNTLSLYTIFETSCAKFKDILRQKKVVIMRIKREYESECMQNLEEILRQSMQQRQKHSRYPPKPAPSIEPQDDYEEVIEEEANYYQMIEKSESKQRRSAFEPMQVQEKNSYSINESSSFSWTKTDSSQMMEEEQDDLNTSQILSVNRSFT